MKVSHEHCLFVGKHQRHALLTAIGNTANYGSYLIASIQPTPFIKQICPHILRWDKFEQFAKRALQLKNGLVLMVASLDVFNNSLSVFERLCQQNPLVIYTEQPNLSASELTLFQSLSFRILQTDFDIPF